MAGQFVKCALRGSACDIAHSLCPGDTEWNPVCSESVWCQLCDCLQQPLMIIDNSEGTGVYYRPIGVGAVDAQPVQCDIPTATAHTGEGTECFDLKDPRVCVIMARENDEFEALTFVASSGIAETGVKCARREALPQQTIGRSAVRRLARRGGTKRMQMGFTEEVNTQLREYLRNLLRDTTALVEMRGKQTVRKEDVLYILQQQGHPLYI